MIDARILFIFLFLIYSTKSYDIPKCCDENDFLYYGHEEIGISCKNEKNSTRTPIIGCTQDEIEISYDFNKFYSLPESCFHTHYWICNANISQEGNATTLKSGLVVCSSDLETCERNMGYEKDREKRNNMLDYFMYSFLLLNSVSIVLLLLTSAIYFSIPQMDDTHGTCVRHYTLTLAIAHFCITSPFLKIGFLYEICITHVYLTIFSIIASFIWMNLLSFSTWRSVRGFSTTCSRRTLLVYCCIAYGIPSTMALLAFLKVIINQWTFNQPAECLYHQKAIANQFFFIPIPIILLLNAFYFVDSLRRLIRNTPNRNQVQQTSTALRSIRFRVCLHFKLFVTTGIIWPLFGIIIVSQVATTIVWYFVIVLILSAEGIFIFIVLVAMRKRVIRGLAQRTYFGIHVFPSSWRNFHGSETGEDDVGPVHYSNNDAS